MKGMFIPREFGAIPHNYDTNTTEEWDRKRGENVPNMKESKKDFPRKDSVDEQVHPRNNA